MEQDIIKSFQPPFSIGKLLVLAIDLGGTKIQYALFGKDNSIELNETAPTEKRIVIQLKTIIRRLQTEYPGQIQMISIGVPGPTKNNVMQSSMPLNYFEDLNFAKTFSDFDIPLIVKNDLNMAAYCELKQGVGKEYKNFCLVSLSTGIGVTAINNGIILEGRIEMGHQVFSPDIKPEQACTNHVNCWVSLASGSGIEKRFGSSENPSSESIFENVFDESALEDLKAINAQAFGNIINAYDPDIIVIMGSLGLKQFDKIIPDSKTIERFTINRPIPGIIKCQAEENIGILGANYAARIEMESLND